MNRKQIIDPLSVKGNLHFIPDVLDHLASQNNCDGPPYDQMVEAAQYIRELESTLMRSKEYYIQFDKKEFVIMNMGREIERFTLNDFKLQKLSDQIIAYLKGEV